MNTGDLADKQMSHSQTENHLQNNGRKSQDQRMDKRNAEHRIGEESLIVLPSDGAPSIGIEQGLVGERCKDAAKSGIEI